MKLKINDLSWDLAFVQSRNQDSDESICGVTRKTRLEIYVNSDMDDTLVYRTIIHELAHAYVWSFGFENFESFKEEDLCNFIESYAKDILSKADDVFGEYKKEKKELKKISNEFETILKKNNK